MAKRFVALIPARSGSKRIKDKNIKNLGEHPLLAYTVKVAINSNLFEDVICVTDSNEYSTIAKEYGARVPILRPKNISGDKSPDIEWVDWILNYLKKENKVFDALFILRPTSPFRKVETLKQALDIFLSSEGADSLRAVEKCKQHPAKMWKLDQDRMSPLMDEEINGTPTHSMQYASLPEMYVQNASLEITWTKTIEDGTISGKEIIPYITRGNEGFDINTEEDWIIAEYLLKSGKVSLPDFGTKDK